MYNAPGVGLTLYELGVPTRPDSEKFVSPVVDYLEGRSEVNSGQIGLIGESFAGYLVPRAAAFEKRIKDTAVWSPAYEVNFGHTWVLRPEPFKDHMIRLLGGKDEVDVFEKSRAYTLRNMPGEITCPIYLLQGSADWLIHRPIEAALAIAR